MKSRTSSSNWTVFKKDITRFAPVWIAYTLCLLVGLLLMVEDKDFWTTANIGYSLTVMGAVTCGYGLLTAQLLFGDLFNTRMCNALHAMPVRRESWFIIHVVCGILFHLVPSIVFTVVAIPVVQMSYVINAWQVPLYWFLGTNLQYLFFFSLAVFCVMCTGNRFAMAVVYGIANVASILLFFLVSSVYVPLLRGVLVRGDVFEDLSPLFGTINGWPVDVDQIKDGEAINAEGLREVIYHGEIKLDNAEWTYLAILAVIGVVLMVTALQLYRKRKLECAGDFSAFKCLDYVFQVLISLSGMAGLTTVVNGFFGMDQLGEMDSGYIIAAIGLIVGWFAGRMLLERSTRVFRLKNFIGMGAMVAVVALSLGLTVLDPLGIEDWVPGVEDIQSATLRLSYNVSVELEDEEALEDIIAIHEKGLELGLDGEVMAVNAPPVIYETGMETVEEEGRKAYYVSIIYEKANGRHAQREYNIWLDDPVTNLVRKHCSTLDQVMRIVVSENEKLTEAQLRNAVQSGDAESITISNVTVPVDFYTEENLNALVDAIVADCEAGTLVQNTTLHDDYIIDEQDAQVKSIYLNFSPENTDLGYYFSIDVYADSENTLAWMESTGIMDQVRGKYVNGYG